MSEIGRPSGVPIETPGEARRRQRREAHRAAAGGPRPPEPTAAAHATPEPHGTAAAHGGAHAGGAEHAAGGAHAAHKSEGWRERTVKLVEGTYKTLLDRRDIQASLITGVGLACIRAGVVWGTGQQLETIDSMVYGAIAGGIRGAVTERFRREGKMGMPKAIYEGMFWGGAGAALGAVGQGHYIDTTDGIPMLGSPIENPWAKVIYGAGMGAATGLVNRTREIIQKRKEPHGPDFLSKGTAWNMAIGAALGGGFVGLKNVVDYTFFGVGHPPGAPSLPVENQGGVSKPGGAIENPAAAPSPIRPIEAKPAVGPGLPVPSPSPSPDGAPGGRIRLPDSIPTPGPRIQLPDVIPTQPPRSELPTDVFRPVADVSPGNNNVTLGVENGTYLKPNQPSLLETQQVPVPASGSAAERYITASAGGSVHLEPQIFNMFAEEASKKDASFLASKQINEIINLPPNDTFSIIDTPEYPGPDRFSPPNIGPEWSSLKGKIEAWIGQDLFVDPDPRILAEIEERIKAENIKFYDGEGTLNLLKTRSPLHFDPYNADHAKILNLMRETKTGSEMFKKEFLGAYMAIKLDNPETAATGQIFHKVNSDYFKHNVELKTKSPGSLISGLRAAA